MNIKQKTDRYLQNIQARLKSIRGGSNDRLNDVQAFLDQLGSDDIQKILQLVQTNLTEVVNFVGKNTRTLDLTKMLGNKKPFKLNHLIPEGNNSISGICIVFRNDSMLGMCSGLRFFSDPQGVNNFQTIAAGKDNKHKLTSIVFNRD